MCKIIGLVLAATFAVAASSSAQSAAALADPKSAAEFALKTCLPAMDDLAKVEAMARENNWLTLPPNPAVNPKFTVSKSRWRANGFFVSTWIWVNGNSPHCVAVPPSKTITRDEFFNAISASVELKLVSDKTLGELRIETYEIRSDGRGKVHFSLASTRDGGVSSVMFYRVSTSEPAALPDR